MNNLGQVVGGSSVVRESGVVFQLVTGAFRTSAGQPIDPSTDLLHSPFEEGTAFAINDSGRAVGTLASAVSESQAFVVPGNGPLAFLPGASICLFFQLPCSAAFGINNSATVVGSVVIDIGPAIQQWHAARWTSVLQDLGGQQSAAYAINDFGLTVGLSHAGFGGRAVVFGGLSPLSLGTLGGNACDSCDSIAYGVNNGGAPDPTTPTTARIVGESSLTPTGPHHGFVFQLGPGSQGMQDLGTLCAEGDCDSTAFDINDPGHIVGESETQPSVTHAFLYRNNQMMDLNSLLGPTDQAAWELGEARAINDLGQIVGTGQFQGKTRAFLMTPPLSSVFDNVSLLVAVTLSGQRLGTSRESLGDSEGGAGRDRARPERGCRSATQSLRARGARADTGSVADRDPGSQAAGGRDTHPAGDGGGAKEINSHDPSSLHHALGSRKKTSADGRHRFSRPPGRPRLADGREAPRDLSRPIP